MRTVELEIAMLINAVHSFTIFPEKIYCFRYQAIREAYYFSTRIRLWNVEAFIYEKYSMNRGRSGLSDDIEIARM